MPFDAEMTLVPTNVLVYPRLPGTTKPHARKEEECNSIPNFSMGKVLRIEPLEALMKNFWTLAVTAQAGRSPWYHRNDRIPRIAWNKVTL